MKLQKFLRAFLGEASPTQIILACLIGTVLGFMPGFSQAGGLIVSLCILLLVLNCNLALAGLIEIAARLLSLVLLPVSFELGRLLLDGPTQGLFTLLINAPVTALFGFEYYATTGGLVLGTATGLLMGYFLSRWVTGLRTRLAQAEANSDQFRAITGNIAVRFMLRLLLGKIPTSDYAKLLDLKAKPIRTWGVLLVLALIPTAYFASNWIDGPATRSLIQSNLAQANGATVDLEAAELDLAAGRLSLTGLAVADPQALDTDLFRADRIAVDISTSDLLRKRVHIEEIVVQGGSHGKERKVPGQLTQSPPPSSPKTDSQASPESDSFDLDENWRERLGQVRIWFDKLSNHSSGDLLRAASKEPQAKEASGPDPLTLDEWLDREIQAQGRVHVSADHLILGAPLLQIDRISAPGTTTTLLPDQDLNIEFKNLSTQPHLVETGPSLGVESESGNLALAIALNGASAKGGNNHLSLVVTDLPAEDLAGSLEAISGKVRGGIIDLQVEGDIENRNGAWIDFPVSITLRDSSVRFSGREIPINELQIPVQLRGPIDDLDIQVDQNALVTSITKAAAGALPGAALGMMGDGLEKATNGLSDKVGEDAGGILGGFGAKEGVSKLFGR